MSSAIASPFEELTRVERPRYVVCNAGDEDVEMTVSSIIYLIPARGSLEIGDRMDYERDEKGAILRDRMGNIDAPKIVAGKNGIGTSFNIVKQMFSDEPSFDAAKKGLYVAVADGRDPERERFARAKYVKARCERAIAGQQRWHAVLLKNKSNTPLRMPKRLQADLDFLALHEHGMVVDEDRAPFMTFDGRDFETREAAELYVQRMHPAVWEAGTFEGRALVVERDAVAPPVKAPAAKPVEMVAEVAPPKPEVPALEDGEIDFILDTAVELGVKLTAEERRGVAKGDRAIGEAVTSRLVKAKKGKGKKDEPATEATPGA